MPFLYFYLTFLDTGFNTLSVSITCPVFDFFFLSYLVCISPFLEKHF